MAAPSRKPKISTERAQDWISSVLNPIVDGLRREQRVLSAGHWRWLPHIRSFEYLHPIRKCIPEFYVDNFDDFLEKHPAMAPMFERHDAALSVLSDAVAKAFDRLSTSDAGADFRKQLDRALRDKSVDAQTKQYFISYLVSGYNELSPAYGNWEIYNALPAPLMKLASTLIGSAANDAAKRLAQTVNELLERVARLRKEIADQYGARIVPVPG